MRKIIILVTITFYANIILNVMYRGGRSQMACKHFEIGRENGNVVTYAIIDTKTGSRTTIIETQIKRTSSVNEVLNIPFIKKKIPAVIRTVSTSPYRPITRKMEKIVTKKILLSVLLSVNCVPISHISLLLFMVLSSGGSLDYSMTVGHRHIDLNSRLQLNKRTLRSITSPT